MPYRRGIYTACLIKLLSSCCSGVSAVVVVTSAASFVGALIVSVVSDDVDTSIAMTMCIDVSGDEAHAGDMSIHSPININNMSLVPIVPFVELNSSGASIIGMLNRCHENSVGGVLHFRLMVSYITIVDDSMVGSPILCIARKVILD